MAYNSTSWTTDSNTQAGSSGTTTMGGITLYADFFIGSTESATFGAETHEMLLFNSANYGNLALNPHLGSGTDPATTFTTADSNSERACDVVPCLWYVPDNITIDSVYSLEGADQATGDTTRMHLMSYTFTSGSTSALSSGVVLASSSDVTNSGSEQAYLSTWTVNNSSVAAGKVVVATFRSDTINSDYSVNVRVKYHLS
jgi:hypothetical protein